MGIGMTIKKGLRKMGYDVRYYRPFFVREVLPRGIQTVFDIGANVGEFSADTFTHIPNTLVYAFEPLPDCFAKMEKRFIGNPSFKAWNVALGKETGSVIMQRSSFHPSSSILPMLPLHKKMWPKTAQASEVSVPIQRLDDIALDLPIRGSIMIKMDVQGYEDKVLLGATETLKKTSLLLIETAFVPLYEGQPLFDDIYKIARDAGFSYWGHKEEHFSPLNGERVAEDSIFVRRGPTKKA